MNMKKAIAILLVVLVAGVAFGVEAGTDAGITISATVAGKLYHGFTNLAGGGISTNPTANSIKTLPSAVNSDAPIDLEAAGTATTTTIGYYNMLTTGASGVKVSFKASPLTASIATVDYYVPYKVALGTKIGDGGTVTLVPSAVVDFGAAVPGETVISETSYVDVLTSAGPGRRWASYAVDVTVNGDQNVSYGLPEGTFTGTITAHFITTT